MQVLGFLEMRHFQLCMLPVDHLWRWRWLKLMFDQVAFPTQHDSDTEIRTIPKRAPSQSFTCVCLYMYTDCILFHCMTLTLLTPLLQARLFRYIRLVWGDFVFRVCIVLFHHFAVVLMIWYHDDVDTAHWFLRTTRCRSSCGSQCLNVHAYTCNWRDVSQFSPHSMMVQRWDAYSSDSIQWGSFKRLHIVGVPPHSNDSPPKNEM